MLVYQRVYPNLFQLRSQRRLLLSSSLDATTVTYNTALSADSTWRQAAAYVGNAQELWLQGWKAGTRMVGREGLQQKYECQWD